MVAPHEMRGWPSALGSPSAAIADDDQQYVFWQVPAGHIAETHHTSRWTTYFFSRWKPALITTNRTPYCTAKDLGIHLEATRAGSAYRDFGFVNENVACLPAERVSRGLGPHCPRLGRRPRHRPPQRATRAARGDRSGRPGFLQPRYL
jgi:hypothetical protein